MDGFRTFNLQISAKNHLYGILFIGVSIQPKVSLIAIQNLPICIHRIYALQGDLEALILAKTSIIWTYTYPIPVYGDRLTRVFLYTTLYSGNEFFYTHCTYVSVDAYYHLE